MNWQRLVNPLMLALLRSPLHRMLSRSTLALTVTGRRTGRQYTVPVSYVRDGEALIIVSQADRTWWRNLRGGAPAGVRLRGRDYRAAAEVSEDVESVAAGLSVLVREVPAYRRYFGIELDERGQPTNPARLDTFACDRVIVRLRDLVPANSEE